MRRQYALGATLAWLTVAAACATNPATGQRQLMLMSEAQEIQLGRDSDQDVRKQMGVYNDPQLQRYVNDVGQRLAHISERPNLPWQYTVVDSPAVNAFALPGGYIYITRGILPFLQDEAELAAVLGHETGHVAARHQAAAYSKEVAATGGIGVLGVFVPQTQGLSGLASAGLQLLFLRNTRQNEIEADQLGTGYEGHGGWDPRAMPNLLATLGHLDEATGSSRGVPNWALTHPPAEDRIARVQQAVAAARSPSARTTNRAELERHIDGVIYGDSPEQGILRGVDFVHPVLRFALRFPQGWEVANTPEQVAARERQDSSAGLVLQLAQGSGSPEQIARNEMSQAGLREVGGDRTDINGLPAYVGVYQGAINNEAVVVRAAHIRNQQQTYLVAGIASPRDYQRVERQFNDTIRSFRAISAQEADRVRPSRVIFRTVRPGDTWESLARSSATPSVKASTIAIMNGVTPTTPPRPGDRIRLVVGG